MSAPVTGYIHSFQSLGAVDGPGVRFVVFMQGCPLRCAYCHNPDTWAFAREMQDLSAGTSICQQTLPPASAQKFTPEAVVQKILRFKPYIKNGGVTVSGGEALMQPEFVTELFKLLRAEGLHTALDTSGVGNLNAAERVLAYTDLVLADLKFGDSESYEKYCGVSLERVLEFFSLTQRLKVPLWVRHVVVPGLNDRAEQVQAVAALARSFKNFEKLELLPFRKICISKYEQMGIDFPLKDYEACSDEIIKNLEAAIAL